VLVLENSIAVLADAAFICDVYHHFEYPKTFMKDLRNNLKTNGMVFSTGLKKQRLDFVATCLLKCFLKFGKRLGGRKICV